ncbi:uncharacterized protein [Periplaneta americana]|uniref:uncharacterized protein isoform X1 n=1 Tax=Periplaneta americana TaxID=6978 RepID=UPI0037E72A18
MAWCKPLLRLTTTLLLMEIFTAASENVTEGSVFAPTTELWPSEPDCVAGESKQNICACDAQCARYRDCCRSSPHFKPEEQVLAGSPFTCAHEFGYVLYEVQHCPSTWQGTEVRERCERPDFNYRVPILDAPLTSRSTNITYRNWYCAACHRDVFADSSVIWNAEFQCDDVPDRLESGKSTAELFSFDPETKDWGLEFEGARSVCNLQFRPPLDVYSLLRSCELEVVSQCSKTWMGVQVRNMCESYTARVCHGATTYRNRHCLICNGFSVSEECYFVNEDESYPVSTAMPELPSFTILLDWRRLKRSTCAKSQVYDPIYRVCREVYV